MRDHVREGRVMWETAMDCAEQHRGPISVQEIWHHLAKVRLVAAAYNVAYTSPMSTPRGNARLRPYFPFGNSRYVVYIYFCIFELLNLEVSVLPCALSSVLSLQL